MAVVKEEPMELPEDSCLLAASVVKQEMNVDHSEVDTGQAIDRDRVELNIRPLHLLTDVKTEPASLDDDDALKSTIKQESPSTYSETLGESTSNGRTVPYRNSWSRKRQEKYWRNFFEKDFTEGNQQSSSNATRKANKRNSQQRVSARRSPDSRTRESPRPSPDNQRIDSERSSDNQPRARRGPVTRDMELWSPSRLRHEMLLADMEHRERMRQLEVSAIETKIEYRRLKLDSIKMKIQYEREMRGEMITVKREPEEGGGGSVE